jgi:hypothetical protein
LPTFLFCLSFLLLSFCFSGSGFRSQSVAYIHYFKSCQYIVSTV